MYKILGFVIITCAINASVFTLLSSPESLMLTKDAINQPWRLLTFQFCHISQMHLTENIIGFILIGLIATEIDMNIKDFLLAYYASVFIVIPFILLLAAEYAMAGNSTGIYGALSMTFIKIRKLIPLKVTIPLSALFIFPTTITDLIGEYPHAENYLQSEFYHLIGFVSGAITPLVSIKKPKHILRG
ncbi:MAG: rhomboid family intramembrane serine protease [Candidatus Altiarchaeales archaeon]|nr:rhomboid family intramembrane serine protease [Candidatus Altiarchaeales archaeon]